MDAQKPNIDPTLLSEAALPYGNAKGVHLTYVSDECVNKNKGFGLGMGYGTWKIDQCLKFNLQASVRCVSSNFSA